MRYTGWATIPSYQQSQAQYAQQPYGGYNHQGTNQGTTIGGNVPMSNYTQPQYEHTATTGGQTQPASDSYYGNTHNAGSNGAPQYAPPSYPPPAQGK